MRVKTVKVVCVVRHGLGRFGANSSLIAEGRGQANKLCDRLSTLLGSYEVSLQSGRDRPSMETARPLESVVGASLKPTEFLGGKWGRSHHKIEDVAANVLQMAESEVLVLISHQKIIQGLLLVWLKDWPTPLRELADVPIDHGRGWCINFEAKTIKEI